MSGEGGHLNIAFNCIYPLRVGGDLCLQKINQTMLRGSDHILFKKGWSSNFCFYTRSPPYYLSGQCFLSQERSRALRKGHMILVRAEI